MRRKPKPKAKRGRPIVVSHDTHHTVKKLAAERGTTMQAVAEKAIEKEAKL